MGIEGGDEVDVACGVETTGDVVGGLSMLAITGDSDNAGRGRGEVCWGTCVQIVWMLQMLHLGVLAMVNLGTICRACFAGV